MQLVSLARIRIQQAVILFTGQLRSRPGTISECKASLSTRCFTSTSEDEGDEKHWEDAELLNHTSSKKFFTGQLHSRLAQVSATTCRVFSLRAPNDKALQWVNSREYRTNLAKSFSINDLKGIEQREQQYAMGHEFEFDLYVKVGKQVRLDTIFNPVVHLNDNESIVCLHENDHAATSAACFSDVCREQGECFHFEITESPDSLLQKMFQLDRAYALRIQIHNFQEGRGKYVGKVSAVRRSLEAAVPGSSKCNH